MDSSHYDENYYRNGVTTGKSNYQDYRWLPDTSLPQADWLKRVLRIKEGDTVLDFGCARGYMVKALRMRGVNAFGCDSSEWAVANCDEGVKGYITREIPEGRFDHIIAKDVFEHIPETDLVGVLKTLIAAARKSLLMIVPLTHHIDGSFLRDEDNADPSHVIMWPLQEWMAFVEAFADDGCIVSGSWHYPGLKPASAEVRHSCGFIQITKV